MERPEKPQDHAKIDSRASETALRAAEGTPRIAQSAPRRCWCLLRCHIGDKKWCFFPLFYCGGYWTSNVQNNVALWTACWTELETIWNNFAAPRAPQELSRSPQKATQSIPWAAKSSLRALQERLKSGQGRPKCGHECPKNAQEPPQERPRATQEWLRAPQERPRAPKIVPRASRVPLGPAKKTKTSKSSNHCRKKSRLSRSTLLTRHGPRNGQESFATFESLDGGGRAVVAWSALE